MALMTPALLNFSAMPDGGQAIGDGDDGEQLEAQLGQRDRQAVVTAAAGERLRLMRVDGKLLPAQVRGCRSG